MQAAAGSDELVQLAQYALVDCRIANNARAPVRLRLADLELGFYFVLGGVGAIVFAITFLWAFTNVCTFFSCPRYYRIWKKGGGDPFFDSIDSPLNNDPDSVRYFELYQERARQEFEQLFPPPAAPDFTKSIDDENII